MPRVIHFEIHADDPERAVRFYREIFGWEINKWPGPHDYWLIKTGANAPGIDGGLMRRHECSGKQASKSRGRPHVRVGEFDKFRGDGNIADDVVADLKSCPLNGGDFLWAPGIVGAIGDRQEAGHKRLVATDRVDDGIDFCR